MINIYTKIPSNNDCIAAHNFPDFFEYFDDYDEYKELFIVFAGVDIKEINEYLLFVKKKIEWLTCAYGKYADFAVKPIFVFKELYLAQWFLRIYEQKKDKKAFVAKVKKQFNFFYEVAEIKEQFKEEDRRKDQHPDHPEKQETDSNPYPDIRLWPELAYSWIRKL